MNYYRRINGLRVLCLGIAVLACGCAHKPLAWAPQKEPTTLPTKEAGIVLDPTRIRAGEDPLTDLDGYDAEDLFQLGYDAFSNDDFELSALLYQRMVEEFPGNENVLPARYNLGMALERSGSFEKATKAYQSYVEQASEQHPQDAAETRVRVALLLQRLDRIAESKPVLEQALAEPLLVLPERWEAQILYTVVAASEGRHDRADWNIKGIQNAIRQRTRRDGELFPSQSAMLWYHGGVLSRMHAASYRLDDVDDLVVLEKRLEMKARALLEARQQYKRCLKHRVAEWSGPAALALGGVYEDFRRDLLAAPEPSQLDAEQGSVYRELLDSATGKFLERAAADYRQVLRQSQRYQLKREWTLVIEEALVRCEELLAAIAQGAPSDGTEDAASEVAPGADESP